MISSSVGSGYPGKIFIWDSPWILIRMKEPLGDLGYFFQMAISLLHYVATCSEQFCFWKRCFSNFFRVTTSTQQLLFRSSCFFRAASFFFEEFLFQSSDFFRSSYFCRIATFSERNFYRAATFWEKKVLWGSYFSKELPFRGGIV